MKKKNIVRSYRVSVETDKCLSDFCEKYGFIRGKIIDQAISEKIKKLKLVMEGK